MRTSVGELGAAKREQLLGEERGEAVGADGDVESGLGAGYNDPDGVLPRLRLVILATAVGVLLTGVEETDEAGGEGAVELSGPGGRNGPGLGLPRVVGFPVVEEKPRLGERRRRRDGREKPARRRRHVCQRRVVCGRRVKAGYFIRVILKIGRAHV